MSLKQQPCIDLSAIPGAMAHTLRRELADGVVEFEEAPAGWLTKKGEPRQKPWRAYYWTSLDGPLDQNRVRMPSTTTVLDLVNPKPGLPPWSEVEGIKGALEAYRCGLITQHTTPEEAVEIVRKNRLGADAAKLDAAERGINVHALLEAYMRTGSAPKLSDHPVEHRGYIQALTRFLLAVDPEPVAVEQLVVNVEDGYAGRLDLRARVGDELVTYDAKTQQNGAIYRGAHYQAMLYERGEIACGGQPADRVVVVVFAANGEYREQEVRLAGWQVDACLSHWRGSRPVDSACESANRIEKKLREVAA
jgi:hypothetical protein